LDLQKNTDIHNRLNVNNPTEYIITSRELVRPPGKKGQKSLTQTGFSVSTLGTSRSRDNSVGIATGWTVRVRFPAVQNVSLLHSVQTGSVRSPSLLSSGYRGALFSGINGRSVELTTHLHLVPRSRMVELYLIKHRDNFTFTFTPEATGCWTIQVKMER
jgi:hypothetical protein